MSNRVTFTLRTHYILTGREDRLPRSGHFGNLEQLVQPTGWLHELICVVSLYSKKERMIMMKRMVESLRNARGFTLVELLAVIVILGIIAAIAVPSIGNLIENTQNNADDAEVEMIEEAARIAWAAQDDAFDADEKITVQELKDNGYLDNADDAPAGSVEHDNGTFEFTAD